MAQTQNEQQPQQTQQAQGSRGAGDKGRKEIDAADVAVPSDSEEDSWLMALEAGNDEDILALQIHDGFREILVDSGSEVTACPPEFGKQFGMTVPESARCFRSISGNKVPPAPRREERQVRDPG
jgi:hypothetical protein